MASPLAEFVISLSDGHVVSQGSISDALKKDHRLAEEYKHDEEAMELVTAEADTADSPDPADPAKPASSGKDGKLVVAEEIAVGHVSWKACALFSSILTVFSINASLAYSQTLGHWSWRSLACVLLVAVPGQ